VRPADIGDIVIQPGNMLPPLASPVVLVLAAILLLLACVMLTDLHLLAAARLGELIGPSPIPSLSRQQIGKVAALTGIAMLCGGAVLLALQWPIRPDDRPLASCCLILLGLGGVLATAADLAPTVWPALVGRDIAGVVELAVQYLVLGGCAAMVGSRLVGAGAVRCSDSSGDVARAMTCPGANLKHVADPEFFVLDARSSPPSAIDARRRGRIDRQLALVDLLTATQWIAADPDAEASDCSLERPHLESVPKKRFGFQTKIVLRPR
jgi:hypothetical protein